MSSKSLSEHARKWFGLPTLPVPEGVILPEHDGDMATLDELSERVFDVLDEAFLDGRQVPLTYYSAPTEYFYYQERWAAGLDTAFRYWPDDRAAEQLAVWRAQLDGIGALYATC